MGSWSHRSKSDLEELYINQNLTQQEMAEKMGVSAGTISQWMQRYNIQTGNSKWAKIGEDEIEKLYEIEQSFSDMAEGTEYNRDQIRNASIRHGLHDPRRIDDVVYTDEELLEQIENVKSEYGYVSKRLFESLDDTATVSAVRDHFGSWFDGIERSSVEPTQAQITGGKSTSGKCDERPHENPRGSHSKYRYVRSKVLNRDNHKCQVCGKNPSSDDVEMLHTHHIKPVSSFEDPNDSHTTDNLVTLCKTHHNLVERNDIDCPEPPQS